MQLLVLCMVRLPRSVATCVASPLEAASKLPDLVQADSKTVQQLVPLVLKATASDNISADFQAAGFMILVQLASKAVLADKLLECAPSPLHELWSHHVEHSSAPFSANPPCPPGMGCQLMMKAYCVTGSATGRQVCIL